MRPKPVHCTEDEAYEGTNGGCVYCGELAYGGCEPDARAYECESCGRRGVYGLEELAIMGLLVIDDGETDSLDSIEL